MSYADKVFPCALSVAERLQFKREVQASRAKHCSRVLHEACTNRAQSLGSFFVMIGSIATRDPDLAIKYATHWTAPILMQELAQARETADLSGRAASLMLNFVFDKAIAQTRDRGLSLHVVSDPFGWFNLHLLNRRFRLNDCLVTTHAVFRVTRSSIAVSWRTGNLNAMRHVSGACDLLGSVEFEEVPRISSAGIPVFRDSKEPLIRSYCDRELRSAMSEVQMSTRTACVTLQRFWPEVIDWMEVLLPAIFDVGVPPSVGEHLSGSTGPGAPIYLSRVSDAALHCEDLVHETQHQRFHALVGDGTVSYITEPKLFYISPYRGDPRPMRGIQLGIHAFVAVNELRLRLFEKFASEQLAYEIVLLHIENVIAISTVFRHDKLTEHGRNFMLAILEELKKQHGKIKKNQMRSSLSIAESIVSHQKRVTLQQVPVHNSGLWTSFCESADCLEFAEQTLEMLEEL